MRKLMISVWLLMLSMVATAQTFVIKDKNGNRVTYDVSKIEKVTFQNDPPAFTIHEMKEENTQPEDPGQDPGGNPTEPSEPVIEQTTFVFEEVASFAGDPDFLFSHPDTVYVGGETEFFHFQLRTNAGYNFAASDTWISLRTRSSRWPPKLVRRAAQEYRSATTRPYICLQK